MEKNLYAWMEENLYVWILQQLHNGKIEDCYNYLIDNQEYKLKLWNDTLEYIKSNIKPREINTIQDLAKLLNNNYNDDELKNPYDIDVKKLCKEKKWVVLFPYSDDNLEIRGYIDDELGAWNGGNFKLIKKGEFYQDPEDDEIYRKAKGNELIGCEEDPHISMSWCNDNCKPYTWFIESDYSNVAYFDILDEDSDEGEIWAHCCVIDCSNILD